MKRNVLWARKGGGQTKSKGNEVMGNGICYFCGQKGHYKRNYPNYLRNLKGKYPKGQGIYLILGVLLKLISRLVDTLFLRLWILVLLLIFICLRRISVKIGSMGNAE